MSAVREAAPALDGAPPVRGEAQRTAAPAADAPGGPSTCRAALALWSRLPAPVWIRSFAEHVADCHACHSLFAGPELRAKVFEYLRSLGEPVDLPAPTLECEQVRDVAGSGGQIPLDAFRTSYVPHILGCRRCLALVPSSIAPEVLVGR